MIDNDFYTEILAKLRAGRDERMSNDPAIGKIRDKIAKGTATHKDTQTYTSALGRYLTASYKQLEDSGVLPKSGYTVKDGTALPFLARSEAERQLDLEKQKAASKAFRELFAEHHALVNGVASDVQAAINEKAGIGLKPVTAPINAERVEAVTRAAEDADDIETIERLFGQTQQNVTQSFADDFMRENFEFQGKAGLNPKIIRTPSADACPWCQSLAGEYDYPVDNAEVFARHDNCTCTITYVRGDGFFQNAHSKRSYTSLHAAEIEERIELERKLTRATEKRKSK